MFKKLADEALLDGLGEGKGCYSGEVDVSKNRGRGHLSKVLCCFQQDEAKARLESRQRELWTTVDQRILSTLESETSTSLRYSHADWTLFRSLLVILLVSQCCGHFSRAAFVLSGQEFSTSSYVFFLLNFKAQGCSAESRGPLANSTSQPVDYQ